MSTHVLKDLDEPAENLMDNEKEFNDEINSYCTDCQEEVNHLDSGPIAVNNRMPIFSNNFDNLFQTNIEDANQTLSRATKSFSEIHLEQENHKEIANEKYPTSNSLRQIYVLNPDTEVEVVEEFQIELVDCGEKLCSQNLEKANETKNFSDKAVQTDPQCNKNNNLWDPDFPTDEELQQIDETIQNITTAEADKQKKSTKLKVQDRKNITKKVREVSKPNCNSITSIWLNRRKRLMHLSNDIYQMSSYFDEIRKALTAKEPTMSIPSPPPMTGYDCQFDFPNENRFGKLPIYIQSSKTTKKTSRDSLINSESLSRVGFELSSSSTKRSNNASNNSVSKRFMNGSTTNAHSDINKENRNNDRGERPRLSDSVSMYTYNPLSNRSKRNSKLN